MADYGSVLDHPWEKKENPQAYDDTPYVYVHKEPARHILGTVGGNAVSGIKGNVVDLESDLLGITRPNTWCNKREHLPPYVGVNTIQRKNPKVEIKIDTTPRHLPSYQMWAYPATFAPVKLENTTCKNPEKY